jgi:hypothetical protein
MVGCGGFGPAANAGAAIMVRAAANEPAMVEFARAFLAFMAIILSVTGEVCVRRATRAGNSIGCRNIPAGASEINPQSGYVAARGAITGTPFTIS